jgi:DNA-binding winged helix-turn-helix (wHTH) protein
MFMPDDASHVVPRSCDEHRGLPAELDLIGLSGLYALPPRRAFSFGPFHLLPAQQLLLEGEVPVRLGSRALEILIALVERPGELVSKGELMARVWPDTVVVESNLKVHVAALRRTLGDGRAGNRYVATTPGRGYRFVAPVMVTDEKWIPSALQHKREMRAWRPRDHWYSI